MRTKRTGLLVASFAAMTFGFAPTMMGVLYAALGHPVAFLALPAYFAASFGLMHLWNRWWRERRGRVRADEEGLFLDDERIVARADIRHGHVLERDGRHVVRLGRMLRLVDLAVDDPAEGDAVLRAMRLDAEKSVAVYAMNHGTFGMSFVRGGLLGGVGAVSVIAGLLLTMRDALGTLWLVGALTGITVMAMNQLVRVAVGADGVRVRRLASRARFIPFAAIVEAKTDGRNVTLTLRDGKSIRMHHPAGKRFKPLLFADRAEEGSKLVERINEGIERHRRASAGASLLARGERDTRAWMRDIVLASDEHASFRAPAFPPDDLWRVVEDPAAATTARAAAALALRNRLDDEGRARLRIAADACAAPKLRIALEEAASARTTSELEEAFEELDDDVSGRRASRAL